MKGKKLIKRMLIAALWLGLTGVLWVFLSAAVRSKKSGIIKECIVSISGGLPGEWYLEEKDILKLAGLQDKKTVSNLSLDDIDLEELEQRLIKDPWIKNAQVYVDNKMALYLNVQERKPVARIFNRGGQSFYLGEDTVVLPVTGKAGARLPVFTGYPGSIKKPTASDSLLLADILTLATFLGKDPFWNAQVQQVNIRDKHNFEIIPLVGNHVIELGSVEGHENKFRRLQIFYRHVLTRTGFEKYRVIKAQFDGQIVGVKN